MGDNLTLRMKALADLTQINAWNEAAERSARAMDTLRTSARAYNQEATRVRPGDADRPTTAGGRPAAPHRTATPGGDPTTSFSLPAGPGPVPPLPMPTSTPAPAPMPGAPPTAATAGATELESRQLALAESRESRLQQAQEFRQEHPGRDQKTWYQKAGGFAKQAASTALGVTIGGSVLGLLTGSAEVYMRNSKALAQLGRTFREVEENVASFGGTYAYTIQESVQLAHSLGKHLDVFSGAQARQVAGFARYTGMDANAAAGSIGRISHLAGGFGDISLGQFLGRARASGMSQGRLGEFMDQAGGLAEDQFSRTGRVNTSDLTSLMALPGAVFGNLDPRAQGHDAMGFLQRLGSGFETPATQTLLLRSMGYGTKNGPDWMTAMERLDAGADAQNVNSVLQSIKGFGFTEQATAQSIQGAFPQLRMHEIRALTGLTRDEARMKSLADMVQIGDYEGAQAMLDKEMAAMAPGRGGFAKLGQGRAGVGEAAAVQWEGLQMQLGEPMTKMLLGGREILGNLIGGAENLLGVDWQTVSRKLERGMDALVLMSENFDKGTKVGGKVHNAITLPAEAMEYLDTLQRRSDTLQRSHLAPGQLLPAPVLGFNLAGDLGGVSK